MKLFLLFYFFLYVVTVTIGEKQLGLDDIERENLASERKLKQEKQSAKLSPAQPQHQLQPTQKLVSPAQLQYGFKPMLSTQHVQHQKPQLIQIQSQPQLIQPQPHQIQPQEQPRQLVYPQYTTQTPYVQIQPQYQYQQYENVPYVVDNRLVQSSRTDKQQQLYGQQIIYVQPFTSSSANIQTIVDHKGNLKYYMYVPTQYFSEVKSANEPQQIKNVEYNPNGQIAEVGPQIFTKEPDYAQLPQRETEYITQPQLPPQPAITDSIRYVEAAPEAPQIQYVQASPTPEASVQYQPQQKYLEQPPKVQQYSQRDRPQSLLDSYVPSALQLQYYKQQQNRGSNFVEGTKSVPRTPLTRQTVRIPGAQIETAYSLPAHYRTQQSFKN